MNFSIPNSMLCHWFGEGCAVARVPVATGLSGACVWRLEWEARRYAMRCWPVGFDAERLRAIHGLMEYLERAEYSITPRLLRTTAGESFVGDGGRLWEVASWLPGEAIDGVGGWGAKPQAAVRAVAAFHLAAATYGDFPSGKTWSPGLARRLAVVKELREGQLAVLRTAVRAGPRHEFATQGEALVRGLESALDAVGPLLESTASVPLALQWCLRDVRREHVLFTGDEVTGLVDFGAAAVEAPVGDLARLLGSMVGDDPQAWQTALTEYQAVRPLSAEELRAVAAFDRGGTVAAAANWLRWLFVERRGFARPELVRRQLAGILGRLPALVAG